MKQVFLLALTIASIGCARAGDHPISPDCKWAETDNRALDLQSLADRRHLRLDAETAEDVAIRWADRNFHLRPEWTPKCEACMASLLSGVARQHGMDVAPVEEYRLRRDFPVDLVVIFSFGLVYLAAAYLVSGWIRRRFPQGEPGFWVMTAAMALGVGVAGVLAGNLWSIVIEGVRLNSAHISYRMDRIPARQYWVQFYAVSIVVFTLAALARSRRGFTD